MIGNLPPFLHRVIVMRDFHPRAPPSHCTPRNLSPDNSARVFQGAKPDSQISPQSIVVDVLVGRCVESRRSRRQHFVLKFLCGKIVYVMCCLVLLRQARWSCRGGTCAPPKKHERTSLRAAPGRVSVSQRHCNAPRWQATRAAGTSAPDQLPALLRSWLQ